MSDNIFAEFLETLKKLDVDLKESQIKVVNGTMNVMKRAVVKNPPVGVYENKSSKSTKKGKKRVSIRELSAKVARCDAGGI